MYKGSLDWRLEEESDKKVYLEMEKMDIYLSK